MDRSHHRRSAEGVATPAVARHHPLPEHAAHAGPVPVLPGFPQGGTPAPALDRRAATARRVPGGHPLQTAYQPWDQRLCIIPDADFYKAVADGSAEVVTDTVDTFTPTGIALASGRELDADIIVTATGLELLAFGGIDLSVDGEPVEPGDKYAYRGYMLNEVPNFAWSVGYTNASWTLRVDLTSKAVADLIQHMRAHGYTRAYPTLDGATPPAHGLLELDSGYVRRAGSRLPKAADTAPWLVRHNAILDAVDARRYDVTEAMVFS